MRRESAAVLLGAASLLLGCAEEARDAGGRSSALPLLLQAVSRAPSNCLFLPGESGDVETVETRDMSTGSILIRAREEGDRFKSVHAL